MTNSGILYQRHGANEGGNLYSLIDTDVNILAEWANIQTLGALLDDTELEHAEYYLTPVYNANGTVCQMSNPTDVYDRVSSKYSASLVDLTDSNLIHNVDDHLAPVSVTATSSPTDMTWTWTVSGLPSDPNVRDYCCVVLLGGLNNDTADHNLSGQLYLNGVAKGDAMTTIPVTDSHYYSVQGGIMTIGIKNGDVISGKLWADTTAVLDLQYITFYLIPRLLANPGTLTLVSTNTPVELTGTGADFGTYPARNAGIGIFNPGARVGESFGINELLGYGPPYPPISVTTDVTYFVGYDVPGAVDSLASLQIDAALMQFFTLKYMPLYRLTVPV